MAQRSERAVWKGQRPWVEIWFAVVMDRDHQRAAWIRQTLFVPREGDGRATVWAAWFDASTNRTFAAKHFVPIEQAHIATGAAGEADVNADLIRIGDCRIARTGASGSVEDMSWQLGWSGGRALSAEMPSWLPAPTHARQIAYDADATGSVTIAGVEQPIAGKAIAMHMWGKRRVPTLHWIWSPWLGDGSLEVTAVSLRDRFALGMSSLRLDEPNEHDSWRGRPATSAHLHGLVTATVAGPRRLVHVRGWAEPSAMVGYAYRDTDDRDLMIAQSDVGSAHYEVFTRTAPGVPWKAAEERRVAGGVAVEIHQRSPLPDVRYIGWNDTHRTDAPVAAPVVDAPRVAWPELGTIIAFGLMYRDHAKDIDVDPDHPPYAFTKHARSLSIGSGSVLVPTSSQILAALVDVEPAIRDELVTRLPVIPAVMDYEGELALVALGDIDADALARGAPQPFGLVAANDLTARVCQVLGDNTERQMAFWSCAKSFPRFLPVAPEIYTPEGGIATIPELMIDTRVNGERRQYTSTSELSYPLLTIVRAAIAHAGRPLRRGDVILTGTPAGAGMRLSPLKRRLAELIKDRFRKTELLVASYATSTELLRPGDVIEVDVGLAGRVRTRLTI